MVFLLQRLNQYGSTNPARLYQNQPRTRLAGPRLGNNFHKTGSGENDLCLSKQYIQLPRELNYGSDINSQLKIRTEMVNIFRNYKVESSTSLHLGNNFQLLEPMLSTIKRMKFSPRYREYLTNINHIMFVLLGLLHDQIC